MSAFSRDLRERILAALEQEPSSLQVAARFGVSASFVRKLRIQVREEGHYEPLYHGGRERIVEERHEEVIRAALKENPSATLGELRTELKRRTKLSVSDATMSRTLKRMGITRKRKTVKASESKKPEVEAKRKSFLRRCRNWAAEKLVFIDETGISLSMTPRHAWAASGERAVDHAPYRRNESATLVAALTLEGIRAPFIFPGAMDGIAFRTYVGEVLLPCLQPGDIVVWDNLAVHGDEVVRASLLEHWVTLEFLPPYSPELNPIELAWSKVKHSLRQMAKRDWSSLIGAVRTSLLDVKNSMCEAWFGHCGYAV